MKKLLSAVFSIGILTAIILLIINRCSKTDSDEPKELTANIYLVAPKGSDQTGKTFGCGDILVAESKNIQYEKTPLEAILAELFARNSTNDLHNFVKGPNLILYQVTIANGNADIYLKGDFVITSVCDSARIREQLYETANQFPDIKKINFFINTQTLETYLAIAKKGFK
jgi:hypothetical protein